MDTEKALPVVVGIITDWTNILVARRVSPYVVLDGRWEFPGGKVRINEPPEVALKREILEELGLVVEVHQPVFAAITEYPPGRAFIVFYLCDETEYPTLNADRVVLNPSAISEVRIVDPLDVDELDCLIAMPEAARRAKAAISGEYI